MASPSISLRRLALFGAASAVALALPAPPRAQADDAPELLAQAPGSGEGAAGASARAPTEAELPTASTEPVERAAPPEAPPDDASGPTVEPEPAPDAELDPDGLKPMSAAEASAGGKAQLQKRLQDIEDERASTSNLLPWITVGTGAAVVLMSAIAGIVYPLDCDREPGCQAPAWPSLTVMIGAAVGTAGTIWLLRTDADIRELELKRDQLKLELQSFDYAYKRRAGIAGGSSPQLTMRMAF